MKEARLVLALFAASLISILSIIPADSIQADNVLEGSLDYRYYVGEYVSFTFKLQVEPMTVVYQPGSYFELKISDFKLAVMSTRYEPPVKLAGVKLCTTNYKGETIVVQNIPLEYELEKVGDSLPREVTVKVFTDLEQLVDIERKGVPSEFTTTYWFCGGAVKAYDRVEKQYWSLWLERGTQFKIRFIVPKNPSVTIDVTAPSEVSVNRPFEALIKLVNTGEVSVNLEDVIFIQPEDVSINVLKAGSGQLEPGRSTEFRLRIIPASTGFKKIAFSIPYSYLGVINDEFTGYISFNVLQVAPQDAEQMIQELERLKAELEPKLEELGELHKELTTYSKKVDELYSLADQIQAKLKDLEQKYGELS